MSREITVKYESTCDICGQPVRVGSRASWTPGEGVRHRECVTLRLIPARIVRPRLSRPNWSTAETAIERFKRRHNY